MTAFDASSMRYRRYSSSKPYNALTFGLHPLYRYAAAGQCDPNITVCEGQLDKRHLLLSELL
jgi:hypothetical protein